MLTSAEETGHLVPAVIGELTLRGPAGEPVDFRRTLRSHGVALLPPNRIDPAPWALETTLATSGGMARTVRLVEAAPGVAALATIGGAVEATEAKRLLAVTRRMLRLDDDLSHFYAIAATDPQLRWVTQGAGRMLRSPTVFEDVVKTICTTNCAWSSTERMVGALVEHLGPPDALGWHAFPGAEAMAAAGEGFYREVARAGYRGEYLRSLARQVADGRLDLERLNAPEVADQEAEACLLSLPGVGPYAAAHVMLTALGRYGLLVLDSWTRPAYARLCGRKASDRTIQRRFRKYRGYGGLAFWLFITRDWIDEPG